MVRRQLGQLVRHSAVYGVADVIPYLVNFLLLPIYTGYLTPAEYGAFGILSLFGVTTKIFFRMGLDSGFFRIYYDQQTDRDRQTLATTLFATAVAVSLTLFAACWWFSPELGAFLIGEQDPALVALWVRLVALDTLLNTFAFVPMNLFRIQGRPQAFTGITLIRSFINIAGKVALVMSHWGVSGVLWADVMASVLFVVALSPTLVRNLRWGVSWTQLRAAAGFGLPKVPHGLAHQILNLSDRKIIEMFLSIGAAGLYHVGYMMGTGVKFFLSAFELAWSPFVYSQIQKPNAPQILARLSTYGCGALLGFGLLNAVFGREMLVVMTKPSFHDAHKIIPIVVLAYGFQGMFALTSIGIGISKKAFYYPIMTISAATLNIALNLWWIPLHGIRGAAWATVAGYALMAVMGYRFAQQHYPIPYEWRRMATLILTALAVYAVTLAAPEALVPSLIFKFLAVCLFPAGVWALGFFRPDELRWLRSVASRNQNPAEANKADDPDS